MDPVGVPPLETELAPTVPAQAPATLCLLYMCGHGRRHDIEVWRSSKVHDDGDLDVVRGVRARRRARKGEEEEDESRVEKKIMRKKKREKN